MVDVIDTLECNELKAMKFSVGSGTTPAVSANSLSATNWTPVASIDCDNATNDNLGDMVGFILKVLQEYGLCQGTVAA